VVDKAGILVLAFIGISTLAGCAVKPEPYSEQELAQWADANLTMVSADEEPLTKPVDVYEAMARAIKYNLDYREKAAETALRRSELNLSHYNLLPNAVANAGYADRDNQLASSSFNLETNAPNFGASTSQEKDVRTSDLAFSWNILDFGLSYVRAHQAADKVLIGEEMQRKVTHRLLEDVRYAYWRAISYERLVTRMKRLETRTDNALANSRLLSDSGETKRVTALTSERELIDIKRDIRYLQRDIIVAKSELASLINVKPGTPFELAIDSRPRTPARLPMTFDEMMLNAIRDRPELRENVYQQRINMREARAALIGLLPGLELFTGPNWDSNAFLLNADWVSWGAKASWNLLKVFQYPAKRDVIEVQAHVLKARALALTMSVMTQVHFSRIRFHHFRQELEAADEYRSVQDRLVRQIRDEAQASRVSELALLREEMNTLVAEAKYDIAYSGLQSAYADVFASIGWDPYGTIDRLLPVAAIAASLRSGGFERGAMPSDINIQEERDAV
jgi:outer membrane protein TolC